MISLSFFWFHQVNAQNYPVYNSFMINPYLYNPAEAASDYFYVFFNHRQQWTGIDGSPVLSTINVNTLINETFTGIGAKASNFSRGILRTTDFAFTYAHGIPLGEENAMFFGLSGGAISNSIDFTKINADDLDDPGFDERLLALSAERMPTGELCPLELLPSADCVDRLRSPASSPRTAWPRSRPRC